MRAPKHLWSGDWERESAAVSEELASLEDLPGVAAQRAPETPIPASPHTPSAETLAPARPRKPPWTRLAALRVLLPSPPVRRIVAIGFAVLLVIAGAAFGIRALTGGAEDQNSPAAAGPTGPVSWLGMEVETLPPGGVVVATIAPGSQGERAGLEPGDVIVGIANRTVNSTADIAKAIGGMHAGQQVPIEVNRGSTRYTTSATLGAPPASWP
jgi:membrane-associated protease RseP (regulator of RpoE activity)